MKGDDKNEYLGISLINFFFFFLIAWSTFALVPLKKTFSLVKNIGFAIHSFTLFFYFFYDNNSRHFSTSTQRQSVLAVCKEGENNKPRHFQPFLWLNWKKERKKSRVNVFCPPRSLKHAVANIDTPLHTFSHPPHFSYLFYNIYSFSSLQQKLLSCFPSPLFSSKSKPSFFPIHPCLTWTTQPR